MPRRRTWCVSYSHDCQRGSSSVEMQERVPPAGAGMRCGHATPLRSNAPCRERLTPTETSDGTGSTRRNQSQPVALCMYNRHTSARTAGANSRRLAKIQIPAAARPTSPLYRRCHRRWLLLRCCQTQTQTPILTPKRSQAEATGAQGGADPGRKRRPGGCVARSRRCCRCRCRRRWTLPPRRLHLRRRRRRLLLPVRLPRRGKLLRGHPWFVDAGEKRNRSMYIWKQPVLKPHKSSSHSQHHAWKAKTGRRA